MVLGVDQNVAGRRCRRDLLEDIDLDMVASLGRVIESSFDGARHGCCCRSAGESSSRCNYAVVV